MSTASDVAQVLVPVAVELAEPLLKLLANAEEDHESPEVKAAWIRLQMAAKRETLKKARGG